MGAGCRTSAPEASGPLSFRPAPPPLGTCTWRRKKVPGWLINDTGRQKTGAAPNSGPGGGKSIGEAAGRAKRSWGEGVKKSWGGPGPGDISAAKAAIRQRFPERRRTNSCPAGPASPGVSAAELEVGAGPQSQRVPTLHSNCSDLGQQGPTSDSQPQPEASVQFSLVIPPFSRLCVPLQVLGEVGSPLKPWCRYVENHISQ